MTKWDCDEFCAPVMPRAATASRGGPVAAGVHVFLPGSHHRNVDGPRIKSGGDKLGHDSREAAQYVRNAA